MTCPSPTALLSYHPVTRSAKRLSLDSKATHTGSQDKRLCRVHCDGSDVVRMRLERCDLLRGVVIVYAQLEVVGTYIRVSSTPAFQQRPGMRPTCDYPILPCNEAPGAYGYVGELKCLDDRLRYVRPYVDVSCLHQPPPVLLSPSYPYRCIVS